MPTAGALVLSRSGLGYREEGFSLAGHAELTWQLLGHNKVSLSNLV